MTYNPYNWKIKKEKKCYFNEKKEQKCILLDFVDVCSELDMVRVEHANLKSSLKEVEEKLIKLEDKKLSLINELAKHP